MELRGNISSQRRAAGLTQEDVANGLGVSRQTVGKWESGKAAPELEKLVALALSAVAIALSRDSRG